MPNLHDTDKSEPNQIHTNYDNGDKDTLFHVLQDDSSVNKDQILSKDEKNDIIQEELEDRREERELTEGELKEKLLQTYKKELEKEIELEIKEELGMPRNEKRENLSGDSRGAAKASIDVLKEVSKRQNLSREDAMKEVSSTENEKNLFLLKSKLKNVIPTKYISIGQFSSKVTPEAQISSKDTTKTTGKRFTAMENGDNVGEEVSREEISMESKNMSNKNANESREELNNKSSSYTDQIAQDEFLKERFGKLPVENQENQENQEENKDEKAQESFTEKVKDKIGRLASINFPPVLDILEDNTIEYLEHDHTKEAIILGENLLDWGYPFERYSVQTASGWVIEMHRVKHGKNEKTPSNPEDPRPVVLLQHGILNSSAAWLVTGPKYSLALKLADAGFDVWLGNNRGTQFARKHKRFTYKDQQFWNWTFQHMGLEDLPTQIDFALSLTKQEKLTYIGHSQGTTQAFVGFSTLTSLQDKVNLFIGLAPVASLKNQRNHAFRVLANLKTETLFQWLDVGEFGHRSITTSLLPGIASSFKYKLIAKLNSLWSIVMDCSLDTECLNLLTALEPSPTSVTNLAHWAYLVRSGRFCKRDLGRSLNNQIYGQSGIPPDYPIEDINIPVALFYGDLDLLATQKDVEEFLIPKLPHVVFFEKCPGYKHNDFVWGKSTKDLHEKIINLIRVYSLNDNHVLGRETILTPKHLSASSIKGASLFQHSIHNDASINDTAIETLINEIENTSELDSNQSTSEDNENQDENITKFRSQTNPSNSCDSMNMNSNPKEATHQSTNEPSPKQANEGPDSRSYISSWIYSLLESVSP